MAATARYRRQKIHLTGGEPGRPAEAAIVRVTSQAGRPSAQVDRPAALKGSTGIVKISLSI